MTRIRTMAPVTEPDWYTWHHDYDSPGTALGRRLAAVQAQIRVALDAAKPGPAARHHPAEGWGAAAHRFTGTPDPLEPGARMFTFRGHHLRTGPGRHLSLWTERIVVHAAAPVNPRSGAARPGSASSHPSSPPRPAQRHHI
jgi:hypothetical protein